MTNSPSVIQNITSNFQIDRNLASAEFWSNFADVCAFFVVVAVFAEVLELLPKVLEAALELKCPLLVKKKSKIESWIKWFDKYKHSMEVIGFAFWIIIVLALAGEVFGTRIARHFDSFTIENLRGETALLESNNLVLRSNVAALEAAVQWREISVAQRANLLPILKAFNRANPGVPASVILISEQSNLEAMSYARQFRDLLNESGFKVNLSPRMTLEDPRIEKPEQGVICAIRIGADEKAQVSLAILNVMLQNGIPIIFRGASKEISGVSLPGKMKSGKWQDFPDANDEILIIDIAQKPTK